MWTLQQWVGAEPHKGAWLIAIGMPCQIPKLAFCLRTLAKGMQGRVLEFFCRTAVIGGDLEPPPTGAELEQLHWQDRIGARVEKKASFPSSARSKEAQVDPCLLSRDIQGRAGASLWKGPCRTKKKNQLSGKMSWRRLFWAYPHGTGKKPGKNWPNPEQSHPLNGYKWRVFAMSPFTNLAKGARAGRPFRIRENSLPLSSGEVPGICFQICTG